MVYGLVIDFGSSELWWVQSSDVDVGFEEIDGGESLGGCEPGVGLFWVHVRGGAIRVFEEKRRYGSDPRHVWDDVPHWSFAD